jgi:hypothetical protein
VALKDPLRMILGAFSVLISLTSVAALRYVSPSMFQWKPGPVRPWAAAIVRRPPKIDVAFPPRAYEYETIILTVRLDRENEKSPKPVPFQVVTSDQIQLQGNRVRSVASTESWYFLPKEQGDYIIELRSLETSGPWAFRKALPLRVYRFDHIPRHIYVAATICAAILGAIGGFSLFWPKLFGKKQEG